MEKDFGRRRKISPRKEREGDGGGEGVRGEAKVPSRSNKNIYIAFLSERPREGNVVGKGGGVGSGGVIDGGPELNK